MNPISICIFSAIIIQLLIVLSGFLQKNKRLEKLIAARELEYNTLIEEFETLQDKYDHIKKSSIILITQHSFSEDGNNDFSGTCFNISDRGIHILQELCNHSLIELKYKDILIDISEPSIYPLLGALYPTSGNTVGRPRPAQPASSYG